MMPDGIERVHEQVLEFEAVEAPADLHRVRRGHALGENVLDDRPELQFEPALCLMIGGLYR
jgi:hypothetical protein